MAKVKQRVQLICKDPSRTKQAFKDECDINRIVGRFIKTQGVDYLKMYQGYIDGHYGDFSNVTDYQSAIEQVRAAEDVFMRLPGEVRKKFDHDPSKFLDYVGSDHTKEEMISMGLIQPEVKESTAPVTDADTL